MGEKELLLPCTCGIHIGGVYCFAEREGEEEGFYFSYGVRYHGYDKFGLFSRLKMAWRILRRGTDDFHEVVLTKGDALKLAAFIQDGAGAAAPAGDVA